MNQHRTTIATNAFRPSLAPFRGIAVLIVGLIVGLLVMQPTARAHPCPVPLIQTEDTDKNSQPERPGRSKEKLESFSEPVTEPPAWVSKGSFIDEASQTEFVVIKSDELLKQREAKEELQERLVDTVHAKIDDLFGDGAGEAINVDLSYIQENLLQVLEGCKSDGVYTQQRSWPVSAENLDKLESRYRDAFQCYAQIRFGDEFESWARSEWENRLVASRTLQTGLIVLSTMVVLTLLFGYFTAEHKTRGFYSRRLQTAGVGFFLLLCLIVWWVSSQFAWL